VLVFAIASLPAAVSLHHAAMNVIHQVDFDSVSVVAWQYLYANGSLPWRDYWFPYSGGFDQLAPLYPDVTVRWTHIVLLFSVLLTTGFAVTGRSKSVVIALCAIWVWLEAMGLTVPGASPRYFLGVSVILAAAAAANQRGMWAGAALGIWSFYVFQEEVSQVVYAAPGLLLLAATCIWRPPHGQSRRDVMVKLSTAAGAFLLALAVFLLALTRHGQIVEWWTFVSTVGVLSDYSGWPADVSAWFTMPDSLDQFLMFVTILLLVGGLLQLLWTRFNDVYMAVPSALAILSVMLLQKQVIRPGIETQVLGIPILGIALLVAQRIRLRPPSWRYAAWTAFSGCFLVACFTWSLESNRQRLLTYLDVTSGVAPDLHYTLFGAEEWEPARRRYFSPASVTFSGVPAEEFSAQVQELTHMRAEDNIFVLGDSAHLYMVLRRPVAFYVNLYNQSPLFSQQRTLQWLKEHNPKYLFWNPDESTFDAVPNAVRVPLLYSYAVANFVPVGTAGRFEVLRRRLPDEPADIAYWRGKLGGSLDLGYIPAISSALRDVDDQGAHQMQYLVVRVQVPADGAVYSVQLRLAGVPFTVQFKGRSGIHVYTIALDRLPFTAVGDELGAAPMVESHGAEGISAAFRTLRFAAERLY
jgi:hypothetical protein